MISQYLYQDQGIGILCPLNLRPKQEDARMLIGNPETTRMGDVGIVILEEEEVVDTIKGEGSDWHENQW